MVEPPIRDIIMRIVVACSMLTLLLCVSLGSADLVKSRKEKGDAGLPGGMTDAYVHTFKKNERAVAVASGNGRSCLGLYVFDARGNCLAKDDHSPPATADDLIVNWLPAESGRYAVELRNAGFDNNTYEIALR